MGGVFLQGEGGEGLTTQLLTVKTSSLRNVKQGLGIERSLVNEVIKLRVP
jgi:hypothetical protein